MIPWLCKPGDLGFGSLFSRLLDPLLLFLADIGILSFVPAGRDKAGQPIGLLSEQSALAPFLHWRGRLFFAGWLPKKI